MSIKNVSPATLKAWLDGGEAVVADVREPREYAMEHIEGSTLIPLSSLHPSALPEHEGKRLVLVCHAGTRSWFGCQRIRGAVSGGVYNLEGGIKAWKREGLPLFQFERSTPEEAGVPLAAKLMRFVARFSFI